MDGWSIRHLENQAQVRKMRISVANSIQIHMKFVNVSKKQNQTWWKLFSDISELQFWWSVQSYSSFSKWPKMTKMDVMTKTESHSTTNWHDQTEKQPTQQAINPRKNVRTHEKTQKPTQFFQIKNINSKLCKLIWV